MNNKFYEGPSTTVFGRVRSGVSDLMYEEMVKLDMSESQFVDMAIAEYFEKRGIPPKAKRRKLAGRPRKYPRIGGEE